MKRRKKRDKTGAQDKRDQGRKGMSRKGRLLLLTSAVMLFGGIGLVLVALLATGGSHYQPVENFGPRLGDLKPVLPTPIPEPTEEPTPPEPPPPPPPPSSAPIERVLIPRIGVDAPIVTLSVDKNGVMQDPKTTRDIAWYDFSGYPGWGSNAVFAGHIYLDDKPAVFQKLSQVAMDDQIEVRLEDGTSYTYQITSKQLYVDGNAPVADIINPTEEDTVTLITCGGRIIPGTREYDSRLVVRATRYQPPPEPDQPAPAPEPPPEPAAAASE